MYLWMRGDELEDAQEAVRAEALSLLREWHTHTEGKLLETRNGTTARARPFRERDR